jgi:hypothetical protein
MNDLLDIAHGVDEDAQPSATHAVTSETIATKAPSSATSEPSVEEDGTTQHYELGLLLYYDNKCVFHRIQNQHN